MTKRILALLLWIILSFPMAGCRRVTKPEGSRFPVKEVGFPSATDALGEYCLRKIRPDKRPNLEVYIGGSVPPSELRRLRTIIEKAGMKVLSIPPAHKNGAPLTITLLVEDFSVMEQNATVVLSTIFGPRNGSEESLAFRKSDDGWVLESAREKAVY